MTDIVGPTDSPGRRRYEAKPHASAKGRTPTSSLLSLVGVTLRAKGPLAAATVAA